jgi:hypothetical protein
MQWEIILLLVLAGPFVVYWVARYGIAMLRKKAEAHRKQ